MNPILNISFKNAPMVWELMHYCPLFISDIVIKSMYHNQILIGIPTHFPIENNFTTMHCFQSRINNNSI